MAIGSPDVAADRAAGLRAASPMWFRGLDRQGRQVVSLLDVDPELARRIPGHELALARANLMVAVERLPRGRWDPTLVHARSTLALVVLDGTLLRSARVEERWATELLGPEDVIRPSDRIDGPAGMTREDGWKALEPVRIAILDWRFATAAARWPQLLDEIFARFAQRSARLLTLMSMSSIRRLDLRVLVLLRILSDRWGVVTRDGIRVDLRLTHETLARLACAQRPSVSTAIARLERAGLLTRDAKTFVVPLDLPEAVQHELRRRRAD